MDDKKDVMLEFSIVPTGESQSLSTRVAESLDIVDKSGVDYRLNPMGTVLEGSWEEVFSVVRDCFEKMRESSDRIGITLKVDYRKGHEGRLETKIASVQSKVGRELNK
jgi:uncharacterized protein (TIGR00106 family)